MRRESDDIVESLVLDVYDLQNVTGGSTEQARILDDEELLLLGGPDHPPRGGEGAACGDCIAAEYGQGVDGFDDGSSFGRVSLGLEAAVLVGDEGEEVALGGLGLGCEGGGGGAGGDFSVAVFGRVWVLGFGGSGKEETCGHGEKCEGSFSFIVDEWVGAFL